MPSVLIIAGPNGAGKTTFGDEYLSVEEREFEFVNADEIARGLTASHAQSKSDILAARMMLRRVDELVRAKANFVVETTLATLTYAQKIPAWRKGGYTVSLIYPAPRLSRRIDRARSQARRSRGTWHAGGRYPAQIWKEPQLF